MQGKWKQFHNKPQCFHNYIVNRVSISNLYLLLIVINDSTQNRAGSYGYPELEATVCNFWDRVPFFAGG